MERAQTTLTENVGGVVSNTAKYTRLTCDLILYGSYHFEFYDVVQACVLVDLDLEQLLVMEDYPVVL